MARTTLWALALPQKCPVGFCFALLSGGGVLAATCLLDVRWAAAAALGAVGAAAGLIAAAAWLGAARRILNRLLDDDLRRSREAVERRARAEFEDGLARFWEKCIEDEGGATVQGGRDDGA